MKQSRQLALGLKTEVESWRVAVHVIAWAFKVQNNTARTATEFFLSRITTLEVDVSTNKTSGGRKEPPWRVELLSDALRMCCSVN
ncbi:hypothetical protein [uncultured Gimesia sp.]|uniref:hypothetical protein n=1 Tax=uncultured Gimesia sp. TaxID=1678688 RepID=UPI0030D7B063